VIVHDLSDPYFSEIVRGILQASSQAGQMVLICNTYREPGRELDYVANFRARRTEALILAGSGLEDREYGARMMNQLAEFEATGGRAVLLGRHYAPGDTVLPDNVGGARALGVALAGLGHRNIGVIAGPASLTTTHDRLAGFRLGLQSAGLQLPDERVVTGDFTREAGARGAAELLDRFPTLTAILALNDVMAVGVLSHLRARGIQVPEQVSVCGFDDIPIAQDVWPTLSTVRVPMVEMGARALALALQPRGDEIRVVHLPTQLVLRASTGPAPS
jgi:LacI family transcriptional regulator